VALAGLITFLHASFDMKAFILGKFHYVLYFLVLAMQVTLSISSFAYCFCVVSLSEDQIVLGFLSSVLLSIAYLIKFGLGWQPRMLITLDENLKPLPVPVRVGQAVDVVGQAGRPKTITGFQTHTTPVILATGDRAELATEK
jgi:26S proteasome regulatory subunit N1